jgi:hypothetical protein
MSGKMKNRSAGQLTAHRAECGFATLEHAGGVEVTGDSVRLCGDAGKRNESVGDR